MRSVEAVRFGQAATDGDFRASMFEPVMLIKSTTLKLKYLVSRRTFKLFFRRLPSSGHLWYAIQIPDDPANPCLLWSIVESQEELICINRLRGGERLQIFLFNEEDINVASATVGLEFVIDEDACFSGAEIAAEGSWRQHENSVHEILAPKCDKTLVEARPTGLLQWTEIRSSLVKRHTGRCHPCDDHR